MAEGIALSLRHCFPEHGESKCHMPLRNRDRAPLCSGKALRAENWSLGPKHRTCSGSGLNRTRQGGIFRALARTTNETSRDGGPSWALLPAISAHWQKEPVTIVHPKLFTNRCESEHHGKVLQDRRLRCSQGDDYAGKRIAEANEILKDSIGTPGGNLDVEPSTQ